MGLPCRLTAATTFRAKEAGEGVQGGAGIRVGIKMVITFGADAAPLAQQEGLAEQVGPDLHAVVASGVPLRIDTAQAATFWEKGQLKRRRILDGAFGNVRRPRVPGSAR